MFVLTRNEQRVIVLAIVLLLIGAFVRYSRDLKSMRAIKKPVETSAAPGWSPVIPPDIDETGGDEPGERSPNSSPQPAR